MAISFNITMTNKWLYSLIAVGILLALGVGVWAYNSDMRAGNPPVMGHSAGEINVENSAGEIVSLQDALDGLYGSSTGISGEGASMNLPGTGTYSVLIVSTYLTCEDYATYLLLDGDNVKSYVGYGGDTEGCDQNTIMTKLTGVSAGTHSWGISRGSQFSYLWIATKE